MCSDLSHENVALQLGGRYSHVGESRIRETVQKAMAVVWTRDDEGLTRAGWEGTHGAEEWRGHFRVKTTGTR